MNRLCKTNAMNRLKRKIKSRRGATLVELVATMAILTIVASLSFEAMFIAAEEYRRVASLSECERSISLLQENLNLYVKNASYIRLVDANDPKYESCVTVGDAMYTYIESTIDSEEKYDDLQDAEHVDGHNYIYIFLYRSGPFTYKLAKYTEIDEHGFGGTKKDITTIMTIDNIKEINFNLRQLISSYGSKSWLLDYAIMSPTDFEMIYSKDGTLAEDSLKTENYDNNSGAYSVMSGTVVNNTVEGTGSGKLRMCENLPAVYPSRPTPYDGSRNFVVIRTVPREGK